MKKRIFMLALIMGVLLSFSASAWADLYYKVDSVTPTNPNITASVGDTITVSFQTTVDIQSSTNAVNGYFKNANLVSWDVGSASTFRITESKYTVVNPSAAESETPETVTKSYCLYTNAASVSEGSTLILTLSVDVTGEVLAVGDLPIRVFLYRIGDGANAIEDSTVSTANEVDNSEASPEDGAGVTIEPEPEEDTPDPRGYTGNTDDDYAEYWDGIPPTYPRAVDTGWTQRTTLDKKSGKPKLKTSKVPAFTAGTSGDVQIEITGASPTVNVGIAGKDAVKLYGADNANKDTFIPLTKANIKKYNIPFRVTSYDINSDDEGKASAKASSTVTLAFNGAKVSYKGFPLTFQISNGNTASGKPVTKTLKIDVNDSTLAPVWLAPTKHSDVSDDAGNPVYTLAKTTYSEEEWEEDKATYAELHDDEDLVCTSTPVALSYVLTAMMSFDEENEEYVEATDDSTSIVECIVVLSKDAEEEAEEEEEEEEESDDDPFAGYTVFYIPIASSDYVSVDYYSEAGLEDYIESVSFVKEASQDCIVSYDVTEVDGDEGEVMLYSYTMDYSYYTDDEVTDKKAKELVVPVSKTSKTIPETVYYVSGDSAPYLITVKPEKDKIKTGVKYDIQQPTYNGYGEIEEHGYVTVYGELSEYEKETKTALTFTATNNANKKKTALKVNVIGKTAPVIQKVENGKLTGIKEVEAGKVPSIKVKAKGSKTITYSIPKAADQATLAALGLKFNESKGAVEALNKGVSNPTSTDGTYAKASITVRATNDAGYDEAIAEFGITGAAPKYTTKAMTFTEGVVSYQTIQPQAGKNTVTADSPVAFTYKEDGSNLSSNGLAIVNWDAIKTTVQVPASIDVEVSDDLEIKVGEDEDKPELGTYSSTDVTGEDAFKAGYFTSEDKHFRLISGTVSQDNDEAAKCYASTDVVVVFIEASGDVSVDVMRAESDDSPTETVDRVVESPDESLKNALIIQVTDASKLKANGTKAKKVKATILTTNLGSKEVKGGITITINPASNGSARNNNAASANSVTGTAAYATKNGTAGSRNGTAGTKNGTALPYGSETDEAKAETEGTLTLGAPRTAADLTAAQQAFLAEKGYKVIAVLPEATVDADGQYDIDAELDEDAPEGEEMIYIPFPKDVPEVEDDEIVDFYDEAGAPVEGVPASHKVIASPWFREGVTYEPVIAIEAE